MGKSPFKNFVVRFGAGQNVFREGDVGTTMFIVQSGSIRLYRDIEEARREFGVLEKGDFFGEMSILEGMPRTHCAEAIEDSELIEINSATFDKMIKGNIEIAIRMLRKLSNRLREAERRLDGSDAGANTLTGPSPPTTIGNRGEDAQAAQSGVRLEAEDGSGTTFRLNGTEAMIGRYDPVTELNPDVDLTELDLKRSVSRRHARIVTDDDGVHAVIEEVGALNGTFVNGTRLTAGEPHSIHDGDHVGFGMVKLVFRT